MRLEVSALLDIWLFILIYWHLTTAGGVLAKLEEEKFPPQLVPEQDEFGRHSKPHQSKVDRLGSVLKREVARLRNHRSQEVDLVFLVDSSASVGAENFHNEIKFIRKLLADFTVSFNTTRVVVVTYSSVEQVIRQVDHISSPSPNFHKCFLVEEEIPAISYNSGGTYTLGALLQALDVLQHARTHSKKAVFLITDGYSNGGDPRPTADLLKRLGVTLFTFGIRNGNVKELLAMASNPKADHCFILDSFQEFEALARRALHEDLSLGTFVAEPPSACSKLCALASVPYSAGFCCDPRASCACGTHTGQHVCLCPPGYYGRGIQEGGCIACPEGTFKSHAGPGDKKSCQPCPLPHQTSPLASSSHEQCECQPGHHMRLGKCQSMDCVPLYPPESGHFIRNQCLNVYNSVCGIRCNSGFELHGSGLRTCTREGNWTGMEARCIAKSCRSLSAPRNGNILCSTLTNSKEVIRHGHQVDTECLCSCQEGYRLVGSRKRSCLPNALWTGLPGYCKPITCPLLRRPNHGDVYPLQCGQHKMRFGQRCGFSCQPGFQLQGPALRECVMPGLWSGSVQITRCVDNTPPEIECPRDLEFEAAPDRHFAVVDLPLPTATDNSGISPTVISLPVLTSEAMKLKIGVSTILISASDLSGNRAKCVFNVTVRDTQAPIVDFCRSPPPFLAQPGLGHADDIEWDEPIFHDNSLSLIVVTQSAEFGRFPLGTTLVEYKAKDEAGNVASCSMDITVQEDFCQSPPDPIHGHRNCSDSVDKLACSLACEQGYAFALEPSDAYFCEKYNTVTEVWLPQSNPHPFPECSIIAHSKLLVTPAQISFAVLRRKKEDQKATLGGEFHHGKMQGTRAQSAADGVFQGEQSSSVCGDQFFLRQVTNRVKAIIRQRLDELCQDGLFCDLSDLEAICEEVKWEEMVATNEIFRKKR
eukprot:maker-scaffold212_size255419-snap-gene-0.10 protein:Tk00543 transcript:maker-scaffold212_size255419-snap-gene-0.10-mRNA-1 annotation:"hypothetical protein BRAFLDRAFT_103549"